MRCLFDTHIIVWAVREPERLPHAVAALIEDRTIERFFSVLSIWEIVIKNALGRPGFSLDALRTRAMLLKGGLHEIDITAAHALAVGGLPALHRDPFDRLLVAQAISEGLTLVTADTALADYPVNVRIV